MTTYENKLAIDFGDVGFRRREPFRVRLHASALETLIAQAGRSARVYELAMIQRPGDIWQYVTVELVAVPARLAAICNSARERQKSPSDGEQPWPEGRIPFNDFDALFHYAWDDTEPEDAAWLDHRDSLVMHSYLDQLIAQVRTALARLEWGDPITRHELTRIRDGSHPFHYRDPRRWRKGLIPFDLGSAKFSDGFYRKLEELLRNRDIVSVAHRGRGDYRMYQILCNEQRTRAERLEMEPGHAMAISSLTDFELDREAWDARVRFYSEGLGYGDLFIEQDAFGNSIKDLVESHHRIRSRYILSAEEQGDIAGYTKESGEYGVLYTSTVAIDWRLSIDRSQELFAPQVKRVLAIPFGDRYRGIYSHERIVFLVSGTAPDLSDLAAQVATLGNHADSVTVVLAGDDVAFERAGCQRVVHLVAPEAGGSDLDPDQTPYPGRQALWNALRKAEVFIIIESREQMAKGFERALKWAHLNDSPRFVISLGGDGNASSPEVDVRLVGNPREILAKAMDDIHGW